MKGFGKGTPRMGSTIESHRYPYAGSAHTNLRGENIFIVDLLLYPLHQCCYVLQHESNKEAKKMQGKPFLRVELIAPAASCWFRRPSNTRTYERECTMAYQQWAEAIIRKAYLGPPDMTGHEASVHVSQMVP